MVKVGKIQSKIQFAARLVRRRVVRLILYIFKMYTKGQICCHSYLHFPSIFGSFLYENVFKLNFLQIELKSEIIIS